MSPRFFPLLGITAAAILLTVPTVAARGGGNGPARCGGTVARIAGKRTCLISNARCTRAFDLQYHRYAYHCHGSRLVHDPYAPIRRPLQLPTYSPNAGCQLTEPANLDLSQYGLTSQNFGRMPALVYLHGWPEATLRVTFSDPLFGPWGPAKVLWFIDPSYRGGQVLVRGRQLDGLRSVRFGGGYYPTFELKLSGALDHPSTARFTAPGCYGFQVDGTTFSETIVFRVDAVS